MGLFGSTRVQDHSTLASHTAVLAQGSGRTRWEPPKVALPLSPGDRSIEAQSLDVGPVQTLCCMHLGRCDVLQALTAERSCARRAGFRTRRGGGCAVTLLEAKVGDMSKPAQELANTSSGAHSPTTTVIRGAGTRRAWRSRLRRRVGSQLRPQASLRRR